MLLDAISDRVTTSVRSEGCEANPIISRSPDAASVEAEDSC